MLQAVGKNSGGLINYSYLRWKALYKHEDLAYMGAFLVQLRQAVAGKRLSEKEEREISTKLYDEVNELYPQEHWMMVQADLLEQCYSLFTALYEVCKAKRVAWPQNRLLPPKQALEPNSYPIHSMLNKHESPKSMWEQQESGGLMEEVGRRVGHTLQLKPSLIDHPAANNGVYLRSHSRQHVLPGTLLGFFPGIIMDPEVRLQDVSKHKTEYPFLERSDGFHIHYESVMLPFPVKPGVSYEEYKEIIKERSQDSSRPNPCSYVPPEHINPYALGHKLNHAPNGTVPNALLLDFDIPFTFFPDSYLQYFPYINARPNPAGSNMHPKGCYRAIAVVANRAISDSEELFLDYIYDERTSFEYTPDWLIDPEDRNPFLRKKLYAYKPHAMFQMIHKYKLLKLGPAFEEYYTRIAPKPRGEGLPDVSRAPLLIADHAKPLISR